MLKWLAACIMFIDHFAVVFVSPHSILYYLLRLLGRLAMPIFAYYIAKGFKRTHHFKKYFTRVGLMALASQVPFTLLGIGYSLDSLTPSAFKEVFIKKLFTSFNIGVTFLAALLILYFQEQFSQKARLSKQKKLFYSFGIFLALFLSSFADYSVYGVAMVLLFYFFNQYKEKVSFSYSYLAVAILVLTLLSFGLYGTLMQGFCILSLPLIRYVKEDGIKLPRYFFYWFYPLHMLVLVLFKFLL